MIVTFIKEQITVEVDPMTTVLEAERKAGLKPDAPCGGQGTCGKCIVKIGGEVVKACSYKVESDIEVETIVADTKVHVLTEGGAKSALKVDAFAADGEPGTYGIAYDIGTTTVVGYLLELSTGKVCSIESRLNPQTQYGGDVIMRINYSLENGEEELTDCIRTALNEMTDLLVEKAGIDMETVKRICVVGNTCMHHLFLGIPTTTLGVAPYCPAVYEGVTKSVSECGLHGANDAKLFVLPNIAGFVGADTCGCVLSLRPDKDDFVSLMIDIGTNGEMVMGSSKRLVACSTAAGPAFEGAKIECGMRGAAGAVDHVKYEDGKFSYTTVGGEKPIGLCGSGLIDLTACLLKAGVIDDTGLLDEDMCVPVPENAESGKNSGRAAICFMLVPPEESGNGTGVYLTQKDVREVQLAKGAMAAGIKLLMKELGVVEDQVEKVYIAGAFGNYMDAESAGKIGLITGKLSSRVVPVGNAAGEGAKIALVSKAARDEIEKLARQIDFIELAMSPDFQDCFVDELGFEV